MVRLKVIPEILILFLLLLLSNSVHAQDSLANWDISIFAAGATGEENTNSFAEAQILTAGVYVGRTLADSGSGWRRGRWEYAFDFAPLFVQFTPQRHRF